jgi:hypothetical protein
MIRLEAAAGGAVAFDKGSRARATMTPAARVSRGALPAAATSCAYNRDVEQDHHQRLDGARAER